MKKRHIWQFAVVILVVLAIGGSVYYWRTNAASSNSSINTRYVTVQYGDLTNTVSAAGSIDFPNQEDLTFGSSGNVAEIDVKVGDTVKSGDTLAKLDNSSLVALQKVVTQDQITLSSAQADLSSDMDTTTAELAVVTAQQAIDNAQDALDQAQNPYTDADKANAELSVLNAESQLTNAKDSLDNTQNPSAADIAQAQENINNAEKALQSAQNDYSVLQITIAESDLEAAQEAYNTLLNPDPSVIQQEQDQITIAQANLDTAKATQAAMVPDPLVIQQKQILLTQAQNNLSAAQQSLADIRDGTALNIQLDKLNVDSAQTALDTAQENLSEGTITAPYDGTITAVDVTVGQAVNNTTAIVRITDPSVVTVSAILDEIDVAQVQEGQPASVSVDAISNAKIPGTITNISGTAVTQSGIVSYPVTVTLKVPSQIHLLEGMSATANITTQSVTHVLLVPNNAIGGTISQPSVNVLVNEKIQETPVQLGASDGSSCEVVSGLNEGDVIVVQTILNNTPRAQTTTTTTSNNQQRQGINPGSANFPGQGGNSSVRGGGNRSTNPQSGSGAIPVLPGATTTRAR